MRPRFSFRLLLILLIASAGAAPSAWAEGGVCPQLPLAAQVPRLSDDDKLVLTADEVLLESDGLSNLAGMVQLQQGDKSFSAEALSYDDNQRQVKIGGRSIFRNRAMVIPVSYTHLTLPTIYSV